MTKKIFESKGIHIKNKNSLKFHLNFSFFSLNHLFFIYSSIMSPICKTDNFIHRNTAVA